MKIGILKIKIEWFLKSIFIQEIVKAMAGNRLGSKIHWN